MLVLGALGDRRNRSATRSITPPISSSPALRSRSRFMPGCSISAARARPISAGWAAARGAGASTASLPGWLLIPLAIVAAALFGAAWAAIPACLQAKRGSHIVITTIMFNFIASALMVYLLVNVLIAPGSMTPQSRGFAAGSCPMHELLARSASIAGSPLNLSFLLAAAVLRRRLGVHLAHALRAMRCAPWATTRDAAALCRHRAASA